MENKKFGIIFSMEYFIQKYKQFFQSSAIFLGWLLMIYAGILFIPALFLFYTSEKILSISATITFASLFILGLFTAREKNWIFTGWVALTIALGILLFSIPNGIQLIYLALVTGLVAIASYYGFANHQKPFSLAMIIAGVFFLVIFASHALILSSPQKFGLDIQGNELSTFTKEALQRVSEMDPMEFIKTNKGREIAVQIYDTPIFISQEELESIVKKNPDPIKKFQQSLLSIKIPLTDNPYSYIINMYTHSLINFLREKLQKN